MDPSNSPRHRDPNVYPSRPILRDGGSRRSDGPSVQFQTLPTPSPRPATADSQPTHQTGIPQHGQVSSRHALRPEDLPTQQLRSQRASSLSSPQSARRRSLSHPAVARRPESIPPLTRPTGKAEECPEIEAVVFGKWTAGAGYGPVLDPRTVASLQIFPILNPVLASPSSGDDHLVWNMIFHPSTAIRVRAGVEEPFDSFRYEPASCPRMTIFNVVSPSFPWMLDLRSENLDVGVTIGDILMELFTYLHVGLGPMELGGVSEAYEGLMRVANHTRKGLLSSHERFGFQLIDWMLGNTHFSALSYDKHYLIKRSLPVAPDMLVLTTRSSR
ncbi:hypothetical protein DFS33DRAFT_1280551 [Desarmillaria ectypa]|nr:hypothetical protein DFS33DRAFT_1280551 [Desarmillaria ectypa]